MKARVKVRVKVRVWVMVGVKAGARANTVTDTTIMSLTQGWERKQRLSFGVLFLTPRSS